jgi:uncharacterized protein GlcG (DUF336 family)
MSVTLDEAKVLADSVLAKARERGLTVGVAVVNERAGTVLVVGMDGARPFTPDTAHGKALGTVLWGMAGERLEGRTGNSVFDYVSKLYGDRIVYAKGSALLQRDGVTHGAIGVSGGMPDVDEEIAQAAATEFAARSD